MIIVTGANGQLGRAVVARLLTRVPAEQVGVSVRNPEKAQELKERGVRVRRGDFGDPASLAHAFEGASQVLIVSCDSLGETAVRQHRTAIDIAKKVGARRLLYTSHMGSSPTSLFPPMVDHAATEAALQDSGVAFTALRNGCYAVSALMDAYAGLFKALRLKVTFTIDELVVASQEIAYALTHSHGTQTVLATGTDGVESNREMFIFRRENGSWKIARYMFN